MTQEVSLADISGIADIWIENKGGDEAKKEARGKYPKVFLENGEIDIGAVNRVLEEIGKRMEE